MNNNLKKLNLQKNMTQKNFTTFCNILEQAKCFIQSGGEKGKYWVIVDYDIYEKVFGKAVKG